MSQISRSWDHARIEGHRFTAALYDRVLAASERAGLAQMRADLLTEASGKTLEIGGGTGLNLEHYPAALTSLTVIEPDPHMAKRLRERAAGQHYPFEFNVFQESAEALPFEAARFDTVVSTLVLCTIPNPVAALAELRRVLKADGRLLFLEHVRDPEDGKLGRWQDRFERPWGWLAGGCHPNRDTAATLADAGFELDLRAATLPKGMAIVKPMIVGRARVSA